MIKYLLIFLFVFTIKIGLAQNLVPNPGFEEYTERPTGDSMLYLLKHWTKPNKGTPDFWVAQISKNGDNSLCNNQTSNGYVGIVIRPEYYIQNWEDAGPKWPEYYEYIQVKLISELKKNKEYVIKCDVYFAHQGVYVLDCMNASFLNDSLHENSTKRLKIPFIKLDSSGERLDKENWTTICGNYKAKGGEKYFILGSLLTKDEFRISKYISKEEYKFLEYYKKIYKIYYYIDNVSVEELNSTNSCEQLPPVKKPLLDLKTIKVGQAVKIENIYFETASATLMPASYTSLNSLVDQMKKNLNVKIEISGHTDNVGEVSYNLKLSQDRAKAVMNYLVAKGIDINRLTYKGYGSTKPIAQNTTTEGRTLNRRVEFTILKK